MAVNFSLFITFLSHYFPREIIAFFVGKIYQCGPCRMQLKSDNDGLSLVDESLKHARYFTKCYLALITCQVSYGQIKIAFLIFYHK